MQTTKSRLFLLGLLPLVTTVSLAAGSAEAATAKAGRVCAKVGAKSGKGSNLLVCGRTKAGLRWAASARRATPKATDTTVAHGSDTTIAKSASPTTVKAGDTTVAKAAPTTVARTGAALSDTTIAKQ